ncbi:hypothetical protein ACJRO7_020413 [Eucalyptus globulus]|uniref:TIR domain-containing protein n=1 Tax=Eucalyptus globulus TaxID=34317 RepID=A0ABD3KN92_EUCGL
MAFKEMVLLMMLLASVVLFLPLGPIWSMALIILFGMVGHRVNKKEKTKEDPPLPLYATPRLADELPLAVADDAAGNPESSSTSSSFSPFKYDVYLNFKGPDTRYGIVDHLYRQLEDVGIRVFMDDYDLTPGNEIGLESKGAIERSRISISLFSRTFASCKWCLRDLLQMWECRETNGQTIIPIFYDVEPDDVALRTSLYGDALLEHERRFPDSVEKWRQVLVQIARLKGFTRHNRNWPEGQLVKEVVARVVQLLKEDYQYVNNKLVGIDHHVREMMKKLGVAYQEGQVIEVQGEKVCGVEIWGVRGVGKTTLAKAVFYKMRKLFDAHSFLEDIRSEGVQFSQRKLIADLKKQIPTPHESSSEETEGIASLCHDAKVLIVLDGVDKVEQIKALVGKFTWFGPGSRIIVTTNQKNVFKAFDVGAVEEHTVRPMDQRHAHKLFCMHAFQGDAAQDVSEYFGLSLDIAKVIEGLPSEIVRQASSLREEMNMTRWKTTLGLLQKKTKNAPKSSTFQVRHSGGLERENSI